MLGSALGYVDVFILNIYEGTEMSSLVACCGDTDYGKL